MIPRRTERTEWITCECHTHAVSVHKFELDGDPDTDPSIYMSFWSHGFDVDHRPGFWHRFGCAWRTLWRNDCHGPEMVLNKYDAIKLSNILQEMAATCTEPTQVV